MCVMHRQKDQNVGEKRQEKASINRILQALINRGGRITNDPTCINSIYSVDTGIYTQNLKIKNEEHIIF